MCCVPKDIGKIAFIDVDLMDEIMNFVILKYFQFTKKLEIYTKEEHQSLNSYQKHSL